MENSATGLFLFQAEDGIRYYKVTGVQTCALPISFRRAFPDHPATSVAREDAMRTFKEGPPTHGFFLYQILVLLFFFSLAYSATAQTLTTGQVLGRLTDPSGAVVRSEEHTSELQSPCNLVCRLLLGKKKIRY